MFHKYASTKSSMTNDREVLGEKFTQINVSIIPLVKARSPLYCYFKVRINPRNGTIIKTNNAGVFSGRGEKKEKEKANTRGWFLAGP